MSTVFDEIAKEGEVKGRIDGEAKGIIEIGLEFGVSKGDILSKLQKKLDVSLQVALDYFVKDKRTEVFDAMEDAKRISKDPDTKRYGSFAEALEDLEA